MTRLIAAFGLILMLGAALLAQQASRPERGGPGGMGRFGAPPVLAALDANGDGEVSAQEIDNAAVALRTLDKNKDGKLTREELFGMPRGFGPGGMGGPDPAEIVNRMMAFDRNGDGKLSNDELPERMRGLMTRADANKDGFVDRDELTRAVRRQSTGGRGRGAGPGERRGGFDPREGRDDQGDASGRSPGRDDKPRP